MSGDARVCYHAVPFISRETPDWDAIQQRSTQQTSPHVLKYLANHRININVRQVVDEYHRFPEGSHNEQDAKKELTAKEKEEEEGGGGGGGGDVSKATGKKCNQE